MNAQQARRRREAARARQAARRRERRRRLAVTAVLVVVLVAGISGLAVAVAGHDRRAAPAPVTAALAGLQTGPAPWSANTGDLPQRLQAIGVPALSPVEGTVIHIHQHLDIYVDGHRVTVPAGVGIDPAAGYAPLHTHDDSGVIHVESPTVRTYSLGEFFAVWGVRFTPTCLGGYCAGGGRQLRVYDDGRPYQGDPAGLLLAPHQELVVAFGTEAQLPSPVPSSYRFPPGL